MTITEIITLVSLIILTIVVSYFGYKLINKNKQSLEVDTSPLKETLIRMENDLKNNFTGLTNDQKEAISKWSEALTKLGSNDTNITDLKQQLETLITTSNSKFTGLTNDQKLSIEKWSEALTKLGSNDTNIINLKQQLETLITISNNKFNDVNSKQATNLARLNETFLKLEENIKTIDTLKTDVQSLNNIFYNTKARGTLGEFSLNSILTNILGENPKVWTPQSRMSVEDNKSQSGSIDAVINMGDKERIAIDSKFPLEQYQAIDKAIAEKLDVKVSKDKFKIAVKEKIKEVKKYISPKNNITHAILFIPSEAIFSYLNNDMQEVFETSFKERIWICSPTTLAALLHIISQVQKDHELNKNIIKVKSLITEISQEYERFDKRWEGVKKKILDNRKEIEDLDTTIIKIKNKQVKLDNYNLDENN